VAVFQVAPPSTDTLTLATDPPPASLAVPVILTMVPITKVAPAVGDVIVVTGGKVSVLEEVFFPMLEPLLITKHPAPNRIKLTTASPVRTHKSSA
jgi:hypothetical protein